ncbi:hypothetical protein PFISCL1PPCAC_27001, partial [Pristionchus fissidentatus]
VLTSALLFSIVHAHGNTGPIPPHLRGCANITIKSEGNCPSRGYECDEDQPIRYKVHDDDWACAEVKCVDRNALLAADRQIVDTIRCRNKKWRAEGNCDFVTTSVVCAKYCDVDRCPSDLRRAPSKYTQLRVRPATTKSKCAVAECKYGFAALNHDGTLIKELPSSADVTCTGNGKWRVSDSESFDHVLCKRKVRTCGDYLCDQNCDTISIKEAKEIVNSLESRINHYFKEVDYDGLAELYHDDSVFILNKKTFFGKEGMKAMNLATSKGQAMMRKTWNKALDVGATHFVVSGDAELFVEADNKSYQGKFKQILQKMGKKWYIIYQHCSTSD